MRHDHGLQKRRLSKRKQWNGKETVSELEGKQSEEFASGRQMEPARK
jgi:hypothetical protein